MEESTLQKLKDIKNLSTQDRELTFARRRVLAKYVAGFVLGDALMSGVIQNIVLSSPLVPIIVGAGLLIPMIRKLPKRLKKFKESKERISKQLEGKISELKETPSELKEIREEEYSDVRQKAKDAVSALIKAGKMEYALDVLADYNTTMLEQNKSKIAGKNLEEALDEEEVARINDFEYKRLVGKKSFFQKLKELATRFKLNGRKELNLSSQEREQQW